MSRISEEPPSANLNGRTNHNHVQTNDLVLQMYSHMKVQRQLEQERISRNARIERKRQRLKKTLEESLSTGFSRESFGSKWTQARCGYGVLGQRQESRSAGESNTKQERSHVIPCGDDNINDPNSNCNGKANGNGLALGSSKFKSNNHADNVTPNGSAVVPAIPFTTTTTTNGHTLASQHDQQSEAIHADGTDSKSFNNLQNNGSFQIVKGPGRVRIKFAPAGLRSSTAPGGRRSKFQWDNIPAVTTVTAKMPMINIDGKVL